MTNSCCRLERKNAIAERGNLLVRSQPTVRIGNPASGKPHQPLHESWRRPRRLVISQEGRSRRGPSYDVLPSGDRVGIASPAVTMSAIRDHSIPDSSLLF